MTYTQAQFEKLPKWAQAEIQHLQRQLDNEKSRADEARLDSGPADSDTLLDYYDDVPIRLGRGVRVRFQIDEPNPDKPHSHRDSYVDVHVRRPGGKHKPHLELLAGSTLIVKNNASNVSYVRVEDRLDSEW